MRLLVAIAVIAASLRALMPIGYMASFDGGRLAIVPCAGVVQVTAPLHASDGASHHGHHGIPASNVEHEAPQHTDHRDLANCPFAVGCCADVAHLQVDLPTSFASSLVLFRKLSAPIAEPHASPFSARGPPFSF